MNKQSNDVFKFLSSRKIVLSTYFRQHCTRSHESAHMHIFIIWNATFHVFLWAIMHIIITKLNHSVSARLRCKTRPPIDIFSLCGKRAGNFFQFIKITNEPITEKESPTSQPLDRLFISSWKRTTNLWCRLPDIKQAAVINYLNLFLLKTLPPSRHSLAPLLLLSASGIIRIFLILLFDICSCENPV